MKLWCSNRPFWRSTFLDEPTQHNDDYGTSPSWEDENVFGGQYDEGDGHSDVEDSDALVTQPRQVQFIVLKFSF